MTIQARRFLMLADQRILCRIVIEFGVGPFGRLVTRCAVVIHRIFMRFVVTVTIDAVRWRIAVFIIRCMTVRARVFPMSAD